VISVPRPTLTRHPHKPLVGRRCRLDPADGGLEQTEQGVDLLRPTKEMLGRGVCSTGVMVPKFEMGAFRVWDGKLDSRDGAESNGGHVRWRTKTCN